MGEPKRDGERTLLKTLTAVEAGLPVLGTGMDMKYFENALIEVDLGTATDITMQACFGNADGGLYHLSESKQVTDNAELLVDANNSPDFNLYVSGFTGSGTVRIWVTGVNMDS